MISLGLWQLKIEPEDGIINFKTLFLKAEKVLECLIFKSKLFHSMTVNGKKEFIKKYVYHESGESFHLFLYYMLC